ncbi:MAG: hypothetical protein DMG42_32985 [Acidobacteria bacterium]|nr:MAG: hypothetical protein DMG42_32985 [Acidobacteriota bacterium]
MVFSSCFRKRLDSAIERSGPDFEVWAGVPATAPEGTVQVSGKATAGEKTVGDVRRFGAKKEHAEGSNATGLWKFE